MSAVKFAILFSQILRHSRNSRKFSPAKITESTVLLVCTVPMKPGINKLDVL